MSTSCFSYVNPTREEPRIHAVQGLGLNPCNLGVWAVGFKVQIRCFNEYFPYYAQIGNQSVLFGEFGFLSYCGLRELFTEGLGHRSLKY